jgi:hypothetical protein
MPTFLDKPSRVPASSALPSEVLSSHYRWEHWRGVLFTLVIGLAATIAALWIIHPSSQTPGNWNILAGIWSGGLLLTALASILGWRFAPSSLIHTAQELDRQLVAKNRLEASAAWHDSDSPLARAQREETAAYLRSGTGGAQARPVRALPWLVAGVLALIIAHLSTLVLWEFPWLLHPAGPISPKDLPKAAIIWKSPESESTANPIEEVPTVAVAQSMTGLKDLTLEISVNGNLKKSVPLPAAPFDQPGKKTIKVSLYMDELEVQPFDIVSYFIRARRIMDQKAPDTASDIQFIQSVSHGHGAGAERQAQQVLRDAHHPESSPVAFAQGKFHPRPH